MITKGLGFNILSQEEKNKKKKTFMDYEPGYVGDDNYSITQPTIIPNTNTTTANKSGKTNTATITKEPKRQPFSWTNDDPLDGWDDRSFLEGFYEVDYASSDLDREKRMSQVDEALKDIRNRRAGDMLRWSAGNMPETNQNTFSVNPQFQNALYPEKNPGFYD